MLSQNITKNRKEREMTIREASDFWDDHDFFEFVNTQEVSNIRFKIKKKKYAGLDSNQCG